jgi:GT2 family glycosyltransferase
MSSAASDAIENKSIAVVIVNYNAAHLIEANIDGILAELACFASFRVVIVDNASPGDDRQVLRELATAYESVELVEAPRNGGFAYGNNRGLEAAGSTDLYFLLNPDARPRPGSVERMARTLLAHDKAGVVGPLLVSAEGEVRASAFARSRPWEEYVAGGGAAPNLLRMRSRVEVVEADEIRQTTWIPGAAMLVRQAVIERVGGMDEGYFLYFEETDWLEKIGATGFEILADGGATVEHIEGASTGVVANKSVRTDLPPYWYESWRRFWTRNRTRPEAILAAVMFLAGLLTGRARRTFSHSRGSSGPTLRRFVLLCLWPILRGAEK